MSASVDRHVKIVLPCTNEGEWLRATVDSILETTRYPSFEIFVLANGDETTDFSFIEKPRYRDRVGLKRVSEVLGVGNSINEAVEPGDAAYYVFLDAHCLVEQPDWIERGVACLDAHPRTSMMQPEVRVFTYDGELATGENPDPSRVDIRRCEYAIRWTWPHRDPQRLASIQIRRGSDETYEEMAGGGAVVFARAETFHRLGGYDREVGGWYPETMDYCVEGWLLGYPMRVDPSIRVLHRIKTEGRKYSTSFLDCIHGVLRTAYKYLSPRRCDLAELLFRRHGLGPMVDEALRRLHRGDWLRERDRHLRERIRDDEWLFERFGVVEERLGIRE